MRRLAFALCVTIVLSIGLPMQITAASVVRTWGVGIEPFGVTIDPRDGKVYVAISDHNNWYSAEDMWVIDPALPQPDPPLNMPLHIQLPGPHAMSVLDTALGRLFVPTSTSFAIVDIPTHAVVATVPGVHGTGVALDPVTHHVFVAMQSGVALIDGVNGAVLARRLASDVSDSWWLVAQDPVRHRLYVANGNFSGSPSLVVLDDSDLSVIGNVPLPAIPRLALSVDVARGLVYVGGFADGTARFGSIYAVDETSLQIVKTIDVGGGVASPFSMTLVPETDTLYVSVIAGRTGYPGNAVVVVDTATFSVRQRIALDFLPGQSALHPDGRLYVTEFDKGLLAAITFANSAPVIDQVTVTPFDAKTSDVVFAAVAAHDPDGDTFTLRYRWYRNGALLAGETGATLDLSKPGNGDRGDQISVLVSASDGTLESADSPTSSWAFRVADTSPVASVTLSDGAPRTNDLLTAVASATDADSDALTYTFTWKVNGGVRRVSGSASATDQLDLGTAGNGDRGDTVTVDVTASDGSLVSAPATASAIVANSAPTISVTLSDVTPAKRDVLVATAVGRDADGDALTYSYTWRIKGKVRQVTTGTSATTSSFDLRVTEAEIGDTVSVEVAVTDGLLGASATASATVTPGGR